MTTVYASTNPTAYTNTHILYMHNIMDVCSNNTQHTAHVSVMLCVVTDII